MKNLYAIGKKMRVSQLKVNRCYSTITGCILSICLLGCFEDTGLLSVDNPENVEPLETFRGISKTEEGVVISAEKLRQLKNPKIALVWQFIGFTRRIASFNKSSVNTKSPYDFSGSILTPPPKTVSYTNETALGGLWLFSDEDNDGKLNGLYHPRHAAMLDSLDFLSREYSAMHKTFLSECKVEAIPKNFQETFFISGKGIINIISNSKIIPIFQPKKFDLDTNYWRLLLSFRYQLLHSMNKWEDFFVSRHKYNEIKKMQILPDSLFLHKVILTYKRRLFPLKNKQQDFETGLIALIKKYYECYSLVNSINKSAKKNGWLDYPYQISPDKDWVAGHTKWYHILYLPSDSSLLEILEAEKTSAFKVDGLSRLKTGYNLIHCDNQYVCKVMDWSDNIIINIGDNYEYFIPPSSPPLKPVTSPIPITVPPDTLEKYAGTYELHPFYNSSLYPAENGLWMEYPNRDPFFLTPGQEGIFFSKQYGTQVAFPLDRHDKIEKFIIYDENYKHAGRKLHDIPADSSMAKISTLLNRKLKLVSAAELPALPGKYVLDDDTLSFSESKGGNINVSMPPLAEFTLHRDREQYSHPELGFYFTFKINSKEVLSATYNGVKGIFTYARID